MKLVDVNLLLYAVNRDSAWHSGARTWLERVLSDEEPIGFAWAVILGFLRSSTHSRIFPTPLTPGQAVAVVDEWLAQPPSRVLHPGDDHWRVVKHLLETVGTAGNLTIDTHLAAIAIEHGAELCSTDADFGRFRNLRWTNPLDDVS